MELALDLSPPESRHYRSWNERLRYVARYSQPEEVHVACEMARAVGASALLAVLDRRTEAALRELQVWRELSLWAVVPNMYAFIRDLTDRGPAGAGLARFRRLGPPAMIRAGWTALRQVRALARSDFVAGALWLAEMELAAARPLRVERVFLHPQLTEIALAGRVTGLFAAFADRVLGLGMEPGLVTHNPVVAADLLESQLRRFPVVISPWNTKGYKMVSGRVASEALFRVDPARFWAANITASGAIGAAQAIADAARLGIGGAVLDANAVAALAHRGDPAVATSGVSGARPS